MSLETVEAECAARATAPRVSLADIEAAINLKIFRNGLDLIEGSTSGTASKPTYCDPLSVLTVCLIVLHNGFTIIGKSAPVSLANFDRALGEKLAYEDAVRQIWPLMGFALRDRLAETP